MMNYFRTARMAALCLLGLLATRAPAADGPPAATSSEDDRVSRLEALVNEQRDELTAVRQQLAAANQADVNAARAEQMKQQIREVLSEQEFRESLMPSVTQAGYDNGFYIRSTDGKFSLAMNGLMQFRYTYYNAQRRNHYLAPRHERDDRSGFDIARLRLRFSGNVYSPDLTYALELEQDAGDGYDTVLSEAWVNYRLMDELQFKAGYFRPASTRMQFMDNAGQQFVDRSMVDAVFGFGYGMGVRLWGQAFNKRLEYYFDVLNAVADGESTATGRVITTDEDRQLDNNPALLLRAVWHALSDDPGNDFLEEGDLQHHTKPALDFGFHYAFNQDEYDEATTRIPFPRRTVFEKGGFGLTNSTGLQINQFGFDAAFKYMGFSLTGEYIIRLLDVTNAPYTPLYQFTGDGSTTAQHGAYVQAGYFLPIPGLEKKLELVTRIGGISALSGSQEGSWEYAGSINYYIQGNKVKIQADITKVQEAPISSPYSSLANVNDSAVIGRIQLQVAF